MWRLKFSVNFDHLVWATSMFLQFWWPLDLLFPATSNLFNRWFSGDPLPCSILLPFFVSSVFSLWEYFITHWASARLSLKAQDKITFIVDGAASEVLILRFLRPTVSFYSIQDNNTFYHIHFVINVAVRAFLRHEFLTELKLKCICSTTSLISKISQLAVKWFPRSSWGKVIIRV